MRAAQRSAVAALRSPGRLLAPAILAAGCAIPQEMRSMIDASCSARFGDGSAFPHLQRNFPALDETAAYAVQKACTRRLLRRGERIIGYKAGLTGAGQFARFGLSREALGVLLRSAHLHPAPTGVYHVPVQRYHRPMIEMEVALLLAEDLYAPLPDLASAKRAVAGIAAAVELPDLGFAAGGAPGGPTLIAANVAARYFILGPAHSPETLDPDALHVELRRDGQTVRRGQGSDLALPQWEMALRLLNRIVEEGYRPRRGQILLTGALGGLQAGEAGEYEADFGTLGVIHFLLPSTTEAPR